MKKGSHRHRGGSQLLAEFSRKRVGADLLSRSSLIGGLNLRGVQVK